MISDPLLNKAASLAKKRNYESALRMLKDDEERYYGSFKFYYLYAVICLHSGNFVEAKENFDLARKQKLKDKSTMLGHAVLYLKRMNTVQAVNYYLEVLEMDPKNRTAKKALSVIRKYSASEALSDWMTQERLSKLFPKIPSPGIDSKSILTGSLVSIAVLLFVFILLTGLKVINPFKQKNERASVDFILSSQDRNAPVQVDGSFRYILTRDETSNLYDRALNLFTSYRDEAAKINLNRILESNASESIKGRARLLIDNMEVPGFDNFNRGDNPAYSAVRNESLLYRDVHVIWSGMATNVEITDEHTKFDFLVGYDTRRTLEGIIPVTFYSPVRINTERPLEVLGKVVIFDNGFGLEGVAIHQSGRLEN